MKSLRICAGKRVKQIEYITLLGYTKQPDVQAIRELTGVFVRNLLLGLARPSCKRVDWEVLACKRFTGFKA